MTGEGEVGSLKVTQIKSKIGGTQGQRDTLRSLGLRRMVQAVRHLVTVEEVD
jgi:large subunit ribosomal protein L30